jgi:environmental stress-induced protein Ves
MELDHGEHGRDLLPAPMAPIAFRGDWATAGRLLDGPCRDFKVMTQRGRVLHDLLIIHPGAAGSLLPQAPTVLVFCAQGQASVTGLAGGLKAGELLRIDSDGGAGGEPVLVVVSIRPPSCGPRGARFDLS